MPTVRLALGIPLMTLSALACGPSTATGGVADAVEAHEVAKEPSVQVSPAAGIPSASSVADLVDSVSPSVVNITTLHRRTGHGFQPFEFFKPGPGSAPPRTGAGTGFIIDSDGYVVTNAHVVHQAEQVKVRLRDDREFDARVVGRDAKLDLALLEIEDAPELPSVKLGDSGVLRVGETVVAVGNPFGLGHTVTMGIVSAKARSIGAGPYDAFIQTDASINPGNSGGPLFNLRGEVVGINTAIRAGADGIGFAIPVQSLKDIVPQLRDKGFVERGKLGLMFQPVSADIAKAVGLDRPHGAMVHDVEPGSAAARAGIESGDIILAINDAVIRRAEELPRNVARHAPGSAIKVKVFRAGKTINLEARLDKLATANQPEPPDRPDAPPPKTDTMFGMEVADAPGGGVQVRGMGQHLKGLRRGDVIVQVNGQAVSDVEQFRRKIGLLGGRDAVLLKIRRGSAHRYVGIPITH